MRFIKTAVVVGVALGVVALSGAWTGEDKAAKALEYVSSKRVGDAAFAAEKWDEAIGAYAEAYRISNDSAALVESYSWALYSAKRYAEAMPVYQRGLEIGMDFDHAVLYNMACCLALAGDKEGAIRALQQALDAGFRNIQHVRIDTDLQSLHADPRFQAMAFVKDISKMSRNEGWQWDIKVFGRELERIHFNPYAFMTKQQFDAEIAQLIADVPRLSDEQISVRLMKFVTKLGDGHTRVIPPILAGPTAIAAPLQMFFFEEGLFVTAAGPSVKDLVGAQVLEVEGKPVSDILTIAREYISRDNDIWIRQMVPHGIRVPALLVGLGLSTDKTAVRYKVRDAQGQVREVKLKAEANANPTAEWVTARASSKNPAPLYMKNVQDRYWFEYLPNSKTVYFQYNAVQNKQDESIAAFSARLFDFIEKNDVERLVIDARWNGGGNNFLNRPIVHGLIKCDKINQPGKLFVIVGRGTFSAAMNGVTDIDFHTNALFVGEPTGSKPNFVGESIPVTLPYSQTRMTISDLYWQRSHAMDFRTWIAPDIPAPPSFELYKDNRDPAMEAIAAYRHE